MPGIISQFAGENRAFSIIVSGEVKRAGAELRALARGPGGGTFGRLPLLFVFLAHHWCLLDTCRSAGVAHSSLFLRQPALPVLLSRIKALLNSRRDSTTLFNSKEPNVPRHQANTKRPRGSGISKPSSFAVLIQNLIAACRVAPWAMQPGNSGTSTT
jgi:hypothetical protein